jgi:hypothetical protein
MASLFRELLGDGLDRVPAAVRMLHDAPLPARFEGRVMVRAAEGLLGRWLARMTGLPAKTVEAPVSVTIEADGEAEIWTRAFPPRPMRTRLWREGGLLHEAFGPVEMRFRLAADGEGIVWHPVSATIRHNPVPATWLRGVHARESVREGRYAFDVAAHLPWAGRVVAYEGWLDVA